MYGTFNCAAAFQVVRHWPLRSFLENNQSVCLWRKR